MHSKVWDEIIYPFPNFNGCTVEVWEWLNNFTPHYNGCNYLSMLGLKLIHFSKRGPWSVSYPPPKPMFHFSQGKRTQHVLLKLHWIDNSVLEMEEYRNISTANSRRQTFEFSDFCFVLFWWNVWQRVYTFYCICHHVGSELCSVDNSVVQT